MTNGLFSLLHRWSVQLLENQQPLRWRSQSAQTRMLNDHAPRHLTANIEDPHEEGSGRFCPFTPTKTIFATSMGPTATSRNKSTASSKKTNSNMTTP